MAKNLLNEIYSTYIANVITKGNVFSRRNLSAVELKASFDKLITRKSYKKVWCIRNVAPNNLAILSADIKNHMKVLVPNARTIINMYSKPYQIDINSSKFEASMLTASKQLDRYQKELEGLNIVQRRLGKKVKDENGSRYTLDEKMVVSQIVKTDSYTYIYDTVSEGGSFTLTYFFIEATAKTSKDLKDYRTHLHSFLKKNKIDFSELYGNMSYYVENFSPNSLMHNEKSQGSGINAMLMSVDNIVGLLPYCQEGVGSMSGIYFGLNVKNMIPIFLNFKEAPTAQNIAVFSKSGSGKTFITTNAQNGHVAIKDSACIMDYKGGEYTPVLNYAEGVEIKLYGSKCMCINCLDINVLPDMSEEECKDMYLTCVSGTVNVILAMCALSNEEQIDASEILSKCIRQLYDSNGVVEELIYTYRNSSGIKYRDIMPILESYRNSPSIDDESRVLINKMLKRCAAYLSDTGMKRHMFENEVSVYDCLIKQVIIYNYGKNNVPEGAGFTIDDNIRIEQMIYMNTVKVSYNKKRGLTTDIVLEELQRAAKEKNIMRYANHVATGGRSNNIVLYLLFNSASIFRNSNDTDIGSILSNITTWLIGNIEEADQKTIAEYGDISDIWDYITDIRTKQNLYSHCFACKYDTGKTRGVALLKCSVPGHIEKSDLFVTRDVEEE